MQAATIIICLAESEHVILLSLLQSRLASNEASFYLEGGSAGSYRGAEYRAYYHDYGGRRYTSCIEMVDSVKIRTVAVYCGSNEGKSPVFAEKAAGKLLHDQLIFISHKKALMFYLHTELGAYLAANSIGVVFGGSRCGLLGKMGDALVANGGRLTGIVPEFFTSEILDHPAYSLVSYQNYTSKIPQFGKQATHNLSTW